jgi:hypothetical protein
MSRPERDNTYEKKQWDPRFKDMRNNEGPRSADFQALADGAIAKNAWLFDKTIKRWYTPEKFVKIFVNRVYVSKKELDDFEIKSPMEGIDAGYRQMESIHNRLEIFTKKVLDYYDKRQK